MKIAICVGTRPEIIKMSPVIRALIKKNVDFIIIDSGQHYSENMSRIFFEQLNLPKPDYNLEVGSGRHGEITAEIIKNVEKVLINEKPDVVLVQGDTNTVLGCAISASKLNIKIGHVEAGLRSRDMTMPEEKNRIIVDHISDFLFAPTEEAKNNLIKENICEEKIFVVGNTIVDATTENAELVDNSILDKYGLEKKNYPLATVHRQENVDNMEKLGNIVDSLVNLSEKHKIIFPVHPRTKKRLEEFGLLDKLKNNRNIVLTEPFGYKEFLSLEKNACLTITDSGGVQEEACILGVPCVTIRENTERPETIEVGANVLAGTDVKTTIEYAESMIGKKPGWENPFGDGKSGERIVEIILKNKNL
ncbi:MAG: UDP-N-acetylglucosamine 2-epimerase (non-hydrolyzing) [Candidatus Nanoarchaeia archaeon]|nr:UDP-N-acetylglucosamine 2-epimerase (non-hydrolyzing) [Candidatus Nanoarchaeia archaeon]